MKPRHIIHILVCLAALFLTSCSGIVAGLTGQPVATVSVQRAGQPQAPIIQVSAGDLAQAEAGDPAAAHGLYNAGHVANLVGQAIDVSGK